AVRGRVTPGGADLDVRAAATDGKGFERVDGARGEAGIVGGDAEGDAADRQARVVHASRQAVALPPVAHDSGALQAEGEVQRCCAGPELLLVLQLPRTASSGRSGTSWICGLLYGFFVASGLTSAVVSSTVQLLVESDINEGRT